MVNTHTNLLVLQFEDIEWNYDLENDSLPPLVKYGSYSDVPIQKKTYSYVRAKRMEKVGASNTKILHHAHSKRVKSCFSLNRYGMDEGHVTQNVCHQIRQLDHSARMLSAKSLAKARLIQQFGIVYNNQKNAGSLRWSNKSSQSSRSFITEQSLKTDLCRSVSSTRMTDIPCSNKLKDDSIVPEPNHLTCEDHVQCFKRRSSWAFDKPKENKEKKDASLSETKNLLRSQIRAKGEVKVPDFVYDTIKAYHKDKNYPNESESFESRRRPRSSPSKIDARTKVWVSHLQLAQLKDKDVGQEDHRHTNCSEGKPIDANITKAMFEETKKKTITTKYVACFTQTQPHKKIETAKVKSTIPQGWTLKPVSTFWSTEIGNETQNLKNRQQTTFAIERYTGKTPFSTKRMSSSAPHIREPLKLIQSSDYTDKVARFLMERKVTHQRKLKEMPHGKVTPSNDPMRSHINFYLRTQEEEEEVIGKMRQCETGGKLQEGEQQKEKWHHLWLELNDRNSEAIEDMKSKSNSKNGTSSFLITES